jgi:tRNA-(ms[2]io[6]A)-hydroxylase
MLSEKLEDEGLQKNLYHINSWLQKLLITECLDLGKPIPRRPSDEKRWQYWLEYEAEMMKNRELRG